MEVEKSVKRTSIRRNTQLRTLCADVSNPLKTARHSTSPLASCSNNGGISSRRREARTASPRSPWQNQAHVEKSNKRSPKETADMQSLHNCNNLGHKCGTTTVTAAASPPLSLKTEAGKHELLAERPYEHTPRDVTLHGRQAEVNCTDNILTAQSSSNNSLGVYVKQELARYNTKADRQPCQHLAGDWPHLASSSRRTRTQPPTNALQGWVTEYMPPQVHNQQKCPRRKHSTDTNSQALAGQVLGLSSAICVSTSVSSNLSAHSSSVQKHMLSYHKPTSSNQPTSAGHPVSHHKPAAASNHLHCNKPTFKAMHSLPRENILTTLTAKSPPQTPASSTLAALSGHNTLYRSPQKFRSPESYHKSGSNTHFSRRGLQAFPSDGPEIRTPSVLYKSGDAIVDYCCPMNLESSLRPQRPTSRSINKENLYCTYLHQDAPGQLHVNCQHYKKLVSKETQYSDTESLPGKRTAPPHSSRAVQVKDNGSSTGDVNCQSGNPQLRCRAGGQRCAATSTRQGATEYHPQPSSNHDVSLRRDDDVDKTSDRCASDSSHCGFKCDSLLKEILKAVTSKIARPAIDNKCNPQAGAVAQLSKASDETTQESYAETIKTEHDTDTPSCLFSRQSNKCANRNQVSHRYVCKSSGSNSGKSALPSLVSYSHKNEPSPEHSTVSLEVKSVNLCFRCSNKNADKDSSQQINIKWTTSPTTKSKWKAECIEVTGISDRPEQQANSLSEFSQKLPSRELDQKTYDYDGLPEQSDQTQQACATAAAANEVAKKNGAVEHTSKKEDVASRLMFTNRTKHIQSKPSDTTLTSPSPCRSRQSRYRRTASKHQEDQSGSVNVPPSDPARPNHDVSKVDVGHTCGHSPQTATAEDETNKCLNRKQSCTHVARKAACTCQLPHNEVAYKHKSAAKVLARNPENSLVPRTEEPYLLLHLDWGVFIIIITTVPMLLLLLSLNFYVRAYTVTPEGARGSS